MNTLLSDLNVVCSTNKFPRFILPRLKFFVDKDLIYDYICPCEALYIGLKLVLNTKSFTHQNQSNQSSSKAIFNKMESFKKTFEGLLITFKKRRWIYRYNINAWHFFAFFLFGTTQLPDNQALCMLQSEAWFNKILKFMNR